jgi:hypothetical protein
VEVDAIVLAEDVVVLMLVEIIIVVVWGWEVMVVVEGVDVVGSMDVLVVDDVELMIEVVVVEVAVFHPVSFAIIHQRAFPFCSQLS